MRGREGGRGRKVTEIVTIGKGSGDGAKGVSADVVVSAGVRMGSPEPLNNSSLCLLLLTTTQ